MELALAIALLVVVVIASVVLARIVKHPEDAATHGDGPGDTTSERFYTDQGRPAGPDAEDPPAPPERGSD